MDRDVGGGGEVDAADDLPTRIEHRESEAGALGDLPRVALQVGLVVLPVPRDPHRNQGVRSDVGGVKPSGTNPAVFVVTA